MWEGVVEPRTAPATAGTFTFDVSLPTSTKIRNFHVDASNTTAVRGVISVLMEAKGAYHPLAGHIPVTNNETIHVYIEGEMNPDGGVRGIFTNCTTGDVCHLFITYEVWRPDD